MKLFKQILCLALSLLFIVQMMAGCGTDTRSSGISKGEFYQMMIKTFNYYPLEHSVEDMENADNYDIEAQTMADWGLLPRDIATKNIDGALTREIAALACLNTLYIKKTGDIDSVKDAKLCDFPQEMADAVANGILEPDKNGYIDGMEKINKDECQKLIESTMKAKAANVYDEDEGSVALSEEFKQITGEDILNLGEDVFSIEGYEEALDNYYANEGQEPAVTPMGLTENNGISLTPLSVSASRPTFRTVKDEKKTEQFKINITKSFYEKHFKNCTIGQLVSYTGFEMGLPSSPNYNFNGNLILDYQNQSVSRISPFAGKLVEVIDWEKRGATPINWKSSESCVTLVLEILPEEEIMANTVVDNFTKKISGIDFKTIEKEYFGFKFTIKSNKSKTGIECSATKKFSLSQNEYGNWQDWTAHPKATVKATLDNIVFTANNLQNLFKDKGDGYVKVTCNTTESFTLECGGMRLAPDSNRDGKAWSNISKSRFTDGDGAKEIKLAEIPFKIPDTGITINIYVYLVIGMDGKLTISFSQFDNGFEVIKGSNGKLQVNPIKCSEEKQITGEANLTVEVLAKIYIDFFLIPKRSVLSGEIAAGTDIHLVVALYEKEKNEMKFLNSGYCDAQEAGQALEKHKSLHLCMDINGQIYIRGGMLKNSPTNSKKEGRVTLTHKVAKSLGYDITKWTFTTKDTDLAIYYELPHIENGGFVEECTVNQELKEEAVKRDSENFTLSTTKLVIPDNVCGIVYVVDSPISDKEIKKNSGIKVKSKDANTVKVVYNEKSKSITVEAVNPGSTEVEVYIQKNKKSKKQYTQVFSVTVNEADSAFSPSSQKQAVTIVPLLGEFQANKPYKA